MRFQVWPNSAQLAVAAADLIVAQAQKAVAVRGRFNLVLSGGSTPLAAYELLGGEAGAGMPWAGVHLFWGDERCVPPLSPLSNQGTALAALGPPVELVPENIHPMPTGRDAQAGARAYEDLLRGCFPGSAWPEFDLVLLGVGSDGHTASLFPGSPLLEEKQAWAVPVEAPTHIEPQVERITLTLPVLNAARQVLFLATGGAKREVVALVLDNVATAAGRYPAARVAALDGVTWFIDQAAAG